MLSALPFTRWSTMVGQSQGVTNPGRFATDTPSQGGIVGCVDLARASNGYRGRGVSNGSDRNDGNHARLGIRESLLLRQLSQNLFSQLLRLPKKLLILHKLTVQLQCL